jgi:hypothetical protein
METGYEMEPGPIGHPGRRRAPIVAGAVAIILAALIFKPWAATGTTPPQARTQPSTATALASPAIAVQAARDAVAPAVLAWPAAPGSTEVDTFAASEAEGAIGELASHAGTWGVGNAGVGPRILREEPWSDWAAAAPEAVADSPAHIAIWPGTSMCGRFPSIYDRASLVAITVPTNLAAGWRLTGWWTDGGHVASLAGSIRQVSPTADRGIRYLERTDSARWPSGLYEFHVISGRTSTALTVCLTRRS